MKHIKYIAYISLFLLASCSTTKNLPEGEVLYTGIKKIEVTNEDKSKEGEEALTEIEAADLACLDNECRRRPITPC